jgi:pyruvate dehydrogenase E2 component (dihydrolipoamide acetyltransferase)
VTDTTVTDIVMPPMGVSVEEGTIVKWHVSVGDAVTVDQPICDIATDKVDTEILAVADGVISELVAGEGATVAVGQVLARLAGSGPAAPVSPVSAGPALMAGAGADPTAAAQRAFDRLGRRAGKPASPVARRLAAERGIALQGVLGTGRLGRIRKQDVLDAVAAIAPAAGRTEPSPPREAPAAARGVPLGYDDVPFEIVPTSPHRRAISEHMTRSRQTSAHMTTEVEADMHHVGRVREAINESQLQTGGVRVSYLSFIARAAMIVLAAHPDLNATFQHERTLRWQQVNLGVAVDTPTGLIVPVIRAAEQMTVLGLAQAIVAAAERARTRTLTADDLRAGTFTISNPGSVGAVSAPAIINQPQVAILGTPAIVKRPWVVQTADGTDVIAPRPIMKLALTFDHRAVDGADATRYLVAVKDALESWDAQDYL